MNRPRLALALAGSAIALVMTSPAEAQVAPMPAAVLDRACNGKGEGEITRTDIARAMLVEAGIPAAEIITGRTLQVSDVGHSLDEILAGILEAAPVAQVRGILAEDVPGPRRTALRFGVHALEDRLNDQSERVTVVRPGNQPISLFADGQPAWRITCKAPDPADNPADPPSPPARFAIRETPEELWLTGRARRKAGAFALGFERSRSVLENGTRETNTSFNIDGTVGLRVTPDTSRDFHAYLFATYNLQQDRTRPPPTLAAGESESDDDTNALALGIDGQYAGCLGGCAHGLPLELNLQMATIFDFANDASRLRLRAILTPRPVIDLGLCRVSVFSRGPLRSRCEFSAEIQGARVLRRGTTELGNYDSYLALGGRAGIEFFLPTLPSEDAATGFFASLNYRFLPVVHGPPEDIERLEIKIGHRFWTAGNVGIDVGFTYTKGTNELSFEEEDVLGFGLGLIF
ncbi:MAG TPA: hypothetical protein VIT38_02065 [Allosphingosinicella sp.]